MEISREEVQKIAELAKLELTEEETTLFAEQLSSILDYFQKLSAADTSQVDATASVLPLQNVMRDDTPGAPLPPETVVVNAARAQDNQFLVSAVLDSD